MGLFSVLPEFAWMAEKTSGLARASCSTKEHIRNLPHAWRKALSAGRIQALCSTTASGLAKSRQRIDAHRRSSRQVPEEPYSFAVNSSTATPRLADRPATAAFGLNGFLSPIPIEVIISTLSPLPIK